MPLAPLLPPHLAPPHGLAPLLRAELGPLAPPDLIAAAAIDEARSLQQLAAARELAPALGSNALFVKGIAMALTIYPPGLRPAGDLDLLTTRDLLPRVCNALTAAGFSRDDVAADASPMEIPYFRDAPSGVTLMIDLHYAFTGDQGLQAALSIPIDAILARRQIVDGVPIPSDEDSLLLAAVNLVRSCVDRLVLVVDVARLAARPLDWNSVFSRAKAWRIATPLWVSLMLAHDLFDTPVDLDPIAPRPWKARAIRSLFSREELLRTDRERDPRYRFLFKALSLDSWGDLLRSVAAIPRRLGR